MSSCQVDEFVTLIAKVGLLQNTPASDCIGGSYLAKADCKLIPEQPDDPAQIQGVAGSSTGKLFRQRQLLGLAQKQPLGLTKNGNKPWSEYPAGLDLYRRPGNEDSTPMSVPASAVAGGVRAAVLASPFFLELCLSRAELRRPAMPADSSQNRSDGGH